MGWVDVCGRVVWVWDAETGQLVQKYDETALDDPDRMKVLEWSRYNIPPTAPLPIILAKDGATRVEVARWGFPNPSRAGVVFNTRMERAAASPMWRPLLGKAQCIVPVRGFYEWRRDGTRKVPYFIHRKDGHLMGLGGLYGWRTVAETPRWCVSIGTVGPNEFMQPVHDRMPVVLEQADWSSWMEATDASALGRLAAPAGDVLAMHEVGPRVGSTGHDEPGLMSPRAKGPF